MPVLLALLALPLAEIALFILVGGWIGLWPTLALVALAGVAGVAVLRMTGMAAMARLRGAQGSALLAAALPVADDAFRMAAGMLLILPGFLTDAVALALLLPPVRRALIARLARRVVVVGPSPGAARGAIIEGEFFEVGTPPPNSPSPGLDRLTRH